MINVTYRSVDGARDRREFKTLKGAQKFAHDMVGAHPEMGRDYAVSGDGIGRVRVVGCTLLELFPFALDDAERALAAITKPPVGSLEDIFADFIRQEAGLPEDM